MAGNRGEKMPPLPEAVSKKAETQQPAQEGAFESVESLLPPQEASPVVVASSPAPLPPEPPARPKPLEVIAIREGFYNGERRSPRHVDKNGVPRSFTIPSMKHLGSWMKLVDPVLQKKREEEEKLKGKPAGK